MEEHKNRCTFSNLNIQVSKFSNIKSHFATTSFDLYEGYSVP